MLDTNIHHVIMHAQTQKHTVPVKDRQDDRSDDRQRRAGAVDGSRAKIAERERKRDGATESHLYVAMATSRGVCVCVYMCKSVVVMETGSHSP